MNAGTCAVSSDHRVLRGAAIVTLYAHHIGSFIEA